MSLHDTLKRFFSASEHAPLPFERQATDTVSQPCLKVYLAYLRARQQKYSEEADDYEENGSLHPAQVIRYAESTAKAAAYQDAINKFEAVTQ